MLFGKEDILINNIAWMLRRLPVFGVFGDGQYRLQPIYVDDLAKLAVEQGPRPADATIDAIGPETFTYRELVRTIGQIIGKPRPIVSVPPRVGLCGRLGDRQDGRRRDRHPRGDRRPDADLLVPTRRPPARPVDRLAREHADTLGRSTPANWPAAATAQGPTGSCEAIPVAIRDAFFENKRHTNQNQKDNKIASTANSATPGGQTHASQPTPVRPAGPQVDPGNDPQHRRSGHGIDNDGPGEVGKVRLVVTAAGNATG